MQELKLLNEQEVLGKQFRVYGTAENPLFVARDVAEWIEYDTSSINKMIANVDDEEKVRKNVPTLGGMQAAWLLTEDGLYEVLMQSRKPIAKQFKKKVKEILKSIRKHGAYMTEDTLEKALTSPDFLIRLATKLKEEQERNKALKAENDRMKPKEIFADAVSASDTSMLVRDVAKLIKQNGVPLGEKRFYKWLRDNGYICKGDTSPTQKAMELGLFEVVIRTVERGDRLPIETKTTKVTGKGQQYFINKFLNEKERSA